MPYLVNNEVAETSCRVNADTVSQISTVLRGFMTKNESLVMTLAKTADNPQANARAVEEFTQNALISSDVRIEIQNIILEFMEDALAAVRENRASIEEFLREIDSYAPAILIKKALAGIFVPESVINPAQNNQPPEKSV
jgi:hypothetical protein